MRRSWMACVLLIVLLSGCRAKSQPAPVKSKSEPGAPVATAPVATAPAASGPAAASLFPSGDTPYFFQFDDETMTENEWLLRDGERWVAANQKGPYATWHATPDGVFRRDPLGGDDAAFLRYLPAQLRDNVLWQQRSGNATVRFWLRQRQTCITHDTGDFVTYYKGSCWELWVINRTQLQRFWFVPGAWIVQAAVLVPDAPRDSFHKNAEKRHLDSRLTADTRSEWLATAAERSTFASDHVPPVQGMDAAAFQQAVAPLTTDRATRVELGSQPSFLLGQTGDYSDQPMLVLLDEQGSEWQRLNRKPDSCRVDLLRRPVAVLLQLCRSKREQWQEVAVWYRNGDMLGKAYGWAHQRTEWYADRAEVVGGSVRLFLDQRDPAHHIGVRTYEPQLEDKGVVNMRLRQREFVPADDGLRYPGTPLDVLFAALYARLHDLSAELPRYFSSRAPADQLAAVDLQRFSTWYLDKVQVGKLVYGGDAKAWQPRITDQALFPGEPQDFLVLLSGECCGAEAFLSGQVRFAQDGAGNWVLTSVELKNELTDKGAVPLKKR